MPAIAISKFERFFREAAGLDVDKDDVKRHSDFVYQKLYDLLLMELEDVGHASARAPRPARGSRGPAEERQHRATVLGAVPIRNRAQRWSMHVLSRVSAPPRCEDSGKCRFGGIAATDFRQPSTLSTHAITALTSPSTIPQWMKSRASG